MYVHNMQRACFVCKHQVNGAFMSACPSVSEAAHVTGLHAERTASWEYMGSLSKAGQCLTLQWLTRVEKGPGLSLWYTACVRERHLFFLVCPGLNVTEPEFILLEVKIFLFLFFAN